MVKKKFWSSEKIVSLTAMFISIITLFIFVKQTNIMERQSKLSAMPYLMIDVSYNGVKKYVTLSLKNHGLGPALIENVTLHYNGKSFNLQLIDFLKEYRPEIDSINIINTTTIEKGLAIPSEHEITLLSAGGNDKQFADFVGIMEFLQSDEFDYTIKYKSVYNDRWEINSKSEEPIQLD